MMKNNINTLESVFRQSGTVFTAQKNETLFDLETPVLNMFWIGTGEAHLIRHTHTGQRICLQIAQSALLAESSFYSENYHCDGVAVTDVSGWKLSKFKFERLMKDDVTCQIAFSTYLAENLRKLRTTIEIRSYRRIYDRIEVWVSLFGVDSLKEGTLNAVAEQMGVSPAAFYREFAKWKKAQS